VVQCNRRLEHLVERTNELLTAQLKLALGVAHSAAHRSLVKQSLAEAAARATLRRQESEESEELCPRCARDGATR
jgi:hypothetical protein